MIYFDNAATTAVLPQAAQTAFRLMTEDYANPHSLHGFGLAAEKITEQSRAVLASAMGVESDCLYFTSGGTMSDNLAIRGFLQGKKRGRILTLSLIHI